VSSEIIVHKGRTNVVTVSLGIDVSADTITSEIRSEPDQSAPLLMTWTVDFLTDGEDGELVLSVDNVITAGIQANSGFMDLKRVIGGEPFAVFDRPIEVTFRGTVTE
jgi:hypothetical protein